MGDVELGFRKVVAFPGPGRIVAACEFLGRRYVAVGDDLEKVGDEGVRVGSGYLVDELSWASFWTNDPDPQVPDRKSSTGSGAQISDWWPLSLRAQLFGDVYRATEGTYGWELANIGRSGELGDGLYVYTSPGDGIVRKIWIGAAPPEWAGSCLLDVTDGELVPVSFDGARTLTGMCVSGGRLWVCGLYDDGSVQLHGWDGTDWVQVGVNTSEELDWVFDCGGELHVLSFDGCFRLRDWALTRIGPSGLYGVAVGDAPWWDDEFLAGWIVRNVALADSKYIALGAGGSRFGLAGYGGRAWVLQDAAGVLYGEPHQEVAWIDGARGRGLVKWRKSAANLDNLATWQNRLWGFGESEDGTPVALRLSSSSASVVECGPWRIDQGQEQGSGRLVAIGRPRGGFGQVLVETSADVMLYEIRHEASDGTGVSPELWEMRHEAVVQPVEPVQLDSLTHEASDGTGASPELWELTHEGCDGTGETPELWSLVHEAGVIGWDSEGAGAPDLRELIHEARTGTPGPGEGEVVHFYRADAGSNIVCVRVVVGELLSPDWRAIMRLDRQALDVDDWDSYEELPIGADHTPGQVGSYLEVGVVGPWGAGRRQGVTVAYKRQ